MANGGIGSKILLLPLDGLEPRAAICCGPGYSREELKALLLSQGRSLADSSILRIEEICARVLRVGGEPLKTLARQEALRLLLGERRILARTPELRRLRRQAGFYRKLDRAMQAGRLAVAHAEEAEVYAERLRARFGPSPIREELKLLASAYEAWLEGMDLWDPPRLLSHACAALRDSKPDDLALPQKIVVLSTEKPESLEREFWDLLSSRAEVEHWGFDLEPRGGRWQWQRWHTLDDAADGLADE